MEATNNIEVHNVVYSNELLEYTFSAMCFEDNSTIYYNTKSNILQQEVSGYLCNPVAEDQQAENRKLANRILHSEPSDSLEDGIHYNLPKINLSLFLNIFKDNSSESREILGFIQYFKNLMIKMCLENNEDFEDMDFYDPIDSFFYDQLSKWLSNNSIDQKMLKQILLQTQRETSRYYLRNIDK